MFTTMNIGALDSCIRVGELSTPSDHKVGVCDLAYLKEIVRGMRTNQDVTGWSVKGL